MQRDVEHDYQYGRQFTAHIKQIAGEHLIGEAPFEDDAERATDLVVLRLEAVRIACRVRRARYETRYAHEFTIRAERSNHARTELAKIVEGWGDYLVYGFGEETTRRLSSWLLGDLRIFRSWYSRELARLPAGETPGTRGINYDGRTAFSIFRINDLPVEFIVARATPAAPITPITLGLF